MKSFRVFEKLKINFGQFMTILLKMLNNSAINSFKGIKFVNSFANPKKHYSFCWPEVDI